MAEKKEKKTMGDRFREAVMGVAKKHPLGAAADRLSAADEYNKLKKEGPPNAMQHGEWQRKLDAAEKRMKGQKK